MANIRAMGRGPRREFGPRVRRPRAAGRPRGLVRRSRPAERVRSSVRRCFGNSCPSGRGRSEIGSRPVWPSLPARRIMASCSGDSVARSMSPARRASSWGSIPYLINPPSVPMIHQRGRSIRQMRLDSI